MDHDLQVIKELTHAIAEGLSPSEKNEFKIKISDGLMSHPNIASIWPEFAIWLLEDPEHGMIRLAKLAKQFDDNPERESEVEEAIHRVARLYKDGCSIPAVWTTATEIARDAMKNNMTHLVVRAAAGAASKAAMASVVAWAAAIAVDEAALAEATLQAKFNSLDEEISVSSVWQLSKNAHYLKMAQKLGQIVCYHQRLLPSQGEIIKSMYESIENFKGLTLT